MTFYTSAKDIMDICASVEEKLDLKIIPAFAIPEMDLPSEITQYCSFSEIPDFGKASSGYPPLCQSYILIDKKSKIQPKFRGVGGPNGHSISYMNSTINEDSVELRPGGEFGEDAIILGEILNPLKSKASEKIIRAFRSEFGKRFSAKSGQEWIGTDAFSRLKSGCRLTPFYDHPNPTVVDVRIDQVKALDIQN